MYVEFALLVVPLGVACKALIQRSHLLAPVLVVLLVAGVPGNLMVMADQSRESLATDFSRSITLSLPRSRDATHLPAGARPLWFLYNPYTTMGWLRSSLASGRLPPPSPLDPNFVVDADIVLVQHSARGACHVVRSRATLDLNGVSTVSAYGPVTVRLVSAYGWSGPRTIGRPSRATVFRTALFPLTLAISSSPSTLIDVCI